MALPQLIAEDVQELDALLGELLKRSEASATMLVDKGGFLIAQAGDAAQFDATTLAALAAGSYAATQTMAQLVGEPDFNSVYQQGDSFSLLVVNIDSDCLLIVVFPAQVSVGVVKYYAVGSVERAARCLQSARQRDPGNTVDLSMMNMEDTAEFFQRKRTSVG